jgi:hypothetical protein
MAKKNNSLEKCIEQKEVFGEKLRQINNELSELSGKYNADTKRVMAISRNDDTLFKIRKSLWERFPEYACIAFRTFADALRAMEAYIPHVIIINDTIDSRALEYVIAMASDKKTKIVLIEEPPKTHPQKNKSAETSRILAPVCSILKNPMDLNEVARVLG